MNIDLEILVETIFCITDSANNTLENNRIGAYFGIFIGTKIENGAGKPTNLTVLEDGVKIPAGIDVYKLDGQTIIKAIDDCKHLSGRKIYSMKVKTKPGGKSSEIHQGTKITFPCLAEFHLYTKFPVKVWLNGKRSEYSIWVKSKAITFFKVTGADIWDSVWSSLYYHGVTKIRLAKSDGKEVKNDSEVFNLEGIQDIYADADEKAEASVPCFIEQSDGKYVKTKDFTFVMSKRKDSDYIWGLIKTNIMPNHKDQIIASVRENSKDDDGNNDVWPTRLITRKTGLRSIYVQTKGNVTIAVMNGSLKLGNVYLGSYAFVEHVKIKVLQEFPNVDKVYWHGSEITDQYNGPIQTTSFTTTIKVTLK